MCNRRYVGTLAAQKNRNNDKRLKKKKWIEEVKFAALPLISSYHPRKGWHGGNKCQASHFFPTWGGGARTPFLQMFTWQTHHSRFYSLALKLFLGEVKKSPHNSHIRTRSLSKCSKKKFETLPAAILYQGQHSIFSSSMYRLEAIQLAVSAAVIQAIALRTPSSSQEDVYVITSELDWPQQAAANG